jgi:hypothetical protein
LKKIFIFLLLLTFLTNCEYFNILSQKEWEETSNHDAENVIIYLSGGYFEGGAPRPCYWKITQDGYKFVKLESNYFEGVAFSIFVEGDTVYTCGFDEDSTGQHRACYWIGDKKYELESIGGAAESVAYQIVKKGGILFTAGGDDGETEATYWLNQDKGHLNLGPNNSQAECIFIQQESSSKHSIYIGGRYSNLPCYWKDDKINYLDMGTSLGLTVRSIYVIGNTVFSCGVENDATLPDHACFWENEKLTFLPGGVEARSLFISEENIYIAGFNFTTNYEACYWKNKKKIFLPDSYFGTGNDSFAFSIFVLNDNIYIAGYDDDGSGNNVAWYYINDEKEVFNTSLNAAATAIFVKADNEE